MNNIIGFFGKKQSGKNSAALFIYGAWLHAIGIVNGGYCIKEDGLHITDIAIPPFDELDMRGRFDPFRNTPTMKQFLVENINPYIKIYSFADNLKQFCINVLGLSWEQCYGTNEQKNELTHLKWENMPNVLIEPILNGRPLIQEGLYTDHITNFKLYYHESGFMTGREVMQYFGTHIIRRMYNPAWAKSTLKQINKEQPALAIICDGRFENECDVIKENEGICIKLLREPFGDEDKDASEQLNIPDNKFDLIIDNRQMSLDEQNDELIRVLEPYGILPDMKVLG